MRVRHVHDSSFVFQTILHKLELFQEIVIEELSVLFDYDCSTIYKLIKKIDLNFAKIDSKYKIVKVGSGKYKLSSSDDSEEENRKVK